jgi:dipeptidyl aminopeptidase/acylaminoacyl peptidase
MRNRLLLPALLLAPTAFAAEGQRPMTIVDLINVPRLSDPQLRPDGRQLVYVLSEANWKADKRVSHLWRVNADGSGSLQLTNGADGETSPRWSPDGRTLAFLSKRGDAEAVTQIWLVPNDGGEARQLTSHATAVSNIQWTPDGQALFFSASEPKSADEKAKDKLKDDVYAFDEDFKQQHLWRVSVTDKSERRITSGDFSVGDYELSRDGSKIAWHKGPSPLLGDNLRGEVYVSNADGTGAVQITKNAVPEGNASLSPDNMRVLFTSQSSARFEPYFNAKLFLAPAAGGGETRLLAPGFTPDVEQFAWSKDGRLVYVTANLGVRSEVFSIDVATGKATQLTDGRHSTSGWSYVPAADRHVFALDEQDNPGDLYLLAPGGTPQRVTRVYENLAREYRLPKQERVTWKGADGTAVEGILYYPTDAAPGQRAPLVVQTHGGPQSSDKFGFGSWSSYVQVLTAKGYAVLKPNYRGSTGYGEAFLRDMVGSYFKNAHLDVMAGVDHVIAMGVADGERMAKMGWSAGGHMTNKIITFTNRFKAASSGAGAANWVSMYAQSDVRTYRTPWFGGTPWQKGAPIELYWEHSPLKYVSNVTTPTIFLVGEKDVRVPSPQSVEMYRALKANGVPTRLYMAPREPHGWTELRHQLFKVNVELDWFEKYVTKRSYTWEKAPEEPKEKDAKPVAP